ncbi:Gfo/Idh/MocA family oxidoreductase [Actinoplanes sp. NPDC089786]|uniref:Gfo/Idh/MocA family protein n=1 Tax=Actinoplanes sp. NPDC089786 TaxID=3155185 RepID=UPI00343B7680
MPRAVVIGLGTISKVHLAAIDALPEVELVGAATHDYHKLLDEVRPDVAHVCTPHDTHADIVADCLDRGVNVLLEKPVADTVEAAERVIAAAARAPGLKVGVCLQNRYNAAVQAARKVITPGAAKRTPDATAKAPNLSATATLLWHRDSGYYASAPWRGQKKRAGGGVLINQAIHTLDLLEWLLGDVTGVSGHVGHYGEVDAIDVEDTANARLTHAGGGTSVLFATTTNAVDSPVTIEIVTGDATLLIRDGLTITHRDGRVEHVAERRAGPGSKSYWGASHELLIADFYRTLHDPGPFWIDPAEGTKSLRLIDQLYRR